MEGEKYDKIKRNIKKIVELFEMVISESRKHASVDTFAKKRHRLAFAKTVVPKARFGVAVVYRAKTIGGAYCFGQMWFD